MVEHAQVTEHGHPGPKQYVIIAAVLTIITMLEVLVFYIKMNPAFATAILLFLGFSKFALVVGYYMHLRFDDRRFLAAFGAPFVIMISIAVVLLAVFHAITR